MAALEAASVGQDIKPVAVFLAKLVKDRLKGKDAAKLPRSTSF
jgi:hypothetical protein